jgi:hypothetical protein
LRVRDLTFEHRRFSELADNLREARPAIQQAKLPLVAFTGYQLSEELRNQTDENAKVLTDLMGWTRPDN